MVENEKIKSQTEDLQKLANFIKEKAIPNLVNDLTSITENGKLSDSKSIEEIFHVHGINMRYLGEVCNKVDEVLYPQVKIILERVILVKVLKHIIRKVMRESNPIYLSHAISHVLNCIFAPSYL